MVYRIYRTKIIKSGYFFTKSDSLECDELNNKNLYLNKDFIKLTDDREEFYNQCRDIMNKSSIYDRSLFKEAFKKFIMQNHIPFQ